MFFPKKPSTPAGFEPGSSVSKTAVVCMVQDAAGARTRAPA
jgi:hypothetical protein